jgi:integrase
VRPSSLPSWCAAEDGSRQTAARRTGLDAARGDRLEALYVLAITTGMRLGELLRLRWREVDLEAQVLSIRGAQPGEGAPGRRRSGLGGRSC